MTTLKRACSCALLTLPVTAMAYDLPAVNLGGSSFYDGAPAPQGPGWYVVEYLQYYTSDTLKDGNGDSFALSKQDIDLFVPLTHFIYVPEKKFTENSTLGFDFLVPVIANQNVDDGQNNAIVSAQTGIGDLAFGAFLQFDPVMGDDGPRYSQRVELAFSIPTGDYDADNSINPGSNAWNFNPYYALTYWLTPRWTASTRIAYLWNAKNDDPSPALNAKNDSQAGQAFHVNFASAYALTDKLSVGMNGYWLNQITDTKVDGDSVKGRREKVWAIGPGLVYSLGEQDSVFANVFFEQDAQNRSEGNRFILRFNHHF